MDNWRMCKWEIINALLNPAKTRLIINSTLSIVNYKNHRNPKICCYNRLKTDAIRNTKMPSDKKIRFERECVFE